LDFRFYRLRFILRHLSFITSQVFPVHPIAGTYALVFTAKRKKRLIIGKLGTLNLQPGYYVYVGSAFGPGGLRARIGHHCNKADRKHWHIDYLSEHLAPIEVWYTHDPTRREHHWSERLSHTRGVAIPLAGFGSSDCHCISHLYFFSSRPSGNYFRRKIHSSIADHARIFIKKFLDKN
jgi:Uri superfamily endonuclease